VLAALLIQEIGLKPRLHGRRIVLDPPDNELLRSWQLEHTQLTWYVRDRPWEIERDVILLMKPPLNSAENRDHPFFPAVRVAREAFRAAAGER
jgi:hypothetical protein